MVFLCGIKQITSKLVSSVTCTRIIEILYWKLVGCQQVLVLNSWDQSRKRVMHIFNRRLYIEIYLEKAHAILIYEYNIGHQDQHNLVRFREKPMQYWYMNIIYSCVGHQDQHNLVRFREKAHAILIYEYNIGHQDQNNLVRFRESPCNTDIWI